MAEAHSAVAFSFSITHDGYNINYNREVLNLVWDSGVRSWKKRIARFRVRLTSIAFGYNNNFIIFIVLEWNPKRCISRTHSELIYTDIYRIGTTCGWKKSSIRHGQLDSATFTGVRNIDFYQMNKF